MSRSAFSPLESNRPKTNRPGTTRPAANGSKSLPAPILVAVLTLPLACQSQPAEEPVPEPPLQPIEAVASVRQIMDAMVIPASAAIWNVASEAPADDEAWKQLANHAVRITESANLLLLGDRAVDDEVWRETTVLMRDSGAQALAAIDERNAEGVIDAGNVMIDSCEICHERHLVRQ